MPKSNTRPNPNYPSSYSSVAPAKRRSVQRNANRTRAKSRQVAALLKETTAYRAPSPESALFTLPTSAGGSIAHSSASKSGTQCSHIERQQSHGQF